MNDPQRDGLVLDREARRFLRTTGALVVGVEVIVLVAIWLVQRYFS